MKLKFLALSLLMVAGVNMVNAQNTTNDYVSEDRKHDIRLSVSDGLTQGTSNILGMSIADAILGTKRSDSRQASLTDSATVTASTASDWVPTSDSE
ncbi:hypothetical protein [Bacteroides caecigallinarum]|uniref:hypothetical protein n=1 Tax=Bacteroides caecigallinarum TaxID=1411144 RepID=UPI001F23A720|nr:hypothetical protein [Bacteroides caecigallinarum]